MKKMELKQMEEIEGGSCAPVTAGLALGAAVVSTVFPPAALLGWTLVGSWFSQCVH
ncbi:MULTISPECIES: hypothetical protein [Hydrotalea]|uniref:hypothetical protein n=1 Tax=Hydrotalea TaxID=1004300 RepID=UPI0015CF0800|nr:MULTISPECIES: hypothetical protein [Hydrotalea]